MKGLPSHFGTEADVINCIEVDPAGTRTMLQRLLAARLIWVKVADLAENDPGVTDEIHEIRLEPVNPNMDMMSLLEPRQMKRVQYELREDSLSELVRLGLTVAKVNEYIAECNKRTG